MTDVLVLRGEARLLFDYLPPETIKQMSQSLHEMNPFDVGKVYLSSKLDESTHIDSLQDGMSCNPYSAGQRIPLRPRSSYKSNQSQDRKKFLRNHAKFASSQHQQTIDVTSAGGTIEKHNYNSTKLMPRLQYSR